MQEVWKPIEGFETTYLVNNLGQVKSIPRINTKGKLIKLYAHKSGYLYCCLSQNGKVFNKRVHILVAKAFIPNPYNLPEVNHKDENKSNNNKDNLEWCTKLYNIQYGTGIQKRSKPVTGFRDNIPVVKFISTAEAGRNGFNGHHIIECCNGKRKTHKKLTWKYDEKGESHESES